jgi:hypothetical protein
MTTVLTSFKRVFAVTLILTALIIIISSNSNMKLLGRMPLKKAVSNDAYFTLAYKPSLNPIRINFQDTSTRQPLGWYADVGEPFGGHAGIFEGTGLLYGWKNINTRQPISIEGNGRARAAPEDVLLSTFIHMQANDINTWRYGTFNGIKANAYWELKVLNGIYKVTLAVGDAGMTMAKQVNNINVEGVKAISGFIPIGNIRSPGRFKTVTVTVTVTDGLLTIDAIGGTNTKLCYVEVEPLRMAPYIVLSPQKQDIVLNKDRTEEAFFDIKLSNSINSTATYKVAALYPQYTPKWLSFQNKKQSDSSSIIASYKVANTLPAGTYAARIIVSAKGFTSSSVGVRIRVVNNARPYVLASVPINGECVPNTISIAANELYVPSKKGFKGGVDNNTINSNTVKLYKIKGYKMYVVQGSVQGTGGGDAISFSPLKALEADAIYKFVITSGVKSYSGDAFVPYESWFSTKMTPLDSGKNVLKAEFTKVSIPNTQNKKYTSLVFGPDGKFYALLISGAIERFVVDHATGMLMGEKTINTLLKKHGERTAIGLSFTPNATGKGLTAWVSHSSSGLSAAPLFDGKVSRLEGEDLEKEQEVIINLPRSTRDHMVNSMAFGPDGALYISQGSNSSAGSYDEGWQRNETLLAGAILRLDIAKLGKVRLPLNVKTTSSQVLINKASATVMTLADGTYNPYSVYSPLTIYASGIRNGYDMVWHSNGQLYIPANGSGGGGNSPASVKGTRRPDNTFYNGPPVEGTENVPVQHDWLFRVNPERNLGYFGHPNPFRGEYVINRGYPDNPVYARNTKPDKNYRGASFDFGFNKSPNGVIEYKNSAFNNALKGKLLVCRFSGGGDIMVLEPGSKVRLPLKDPNNDQIYDITNVASGAGNSGLLGFSGFANPLDLVEDTTTGNLYVSEFNWNENPNIISQITLLKVVVPPATQFVAKALLMNPKRRNYKLNNKFKQ